MMPQSKPDNAAVYFHNKCPLLSYCSFCKFCYKCHKCPLFSTKCTLKAFPFQSFHSGITTLNILLNISLIYDKCPFCFLINFVQIKSAKSSSFLFLVSIHLIRSFSLRTCILEYCSYPSGKYPLKSYCLTRAFFFISVLLLFYIW